MSSDIRALREFSNDPYGKFLASLSKKFSAFINKDQAELVENPEDVYSDGQDFDSVLKYHNFTFTNKFDGSKTYYSPSEPDDDTNCRLWLKGGNIGSIVRDYSGNVRNGLLYGDPTLVSGEPFDYGIYDSDNAVKSIAIRFNRPTSTLVNQEYIRVPYDIRHNAIYNLTTGTSFFMRFRLFDLSEQDSWSRTLFQKRDDTTTLPNDGIRVMVNELGSLIVRIRHVDGTQTNKATANGTISTNTVYDLWITYATSGNAVKVYVNNVDKTLSDPGASSSWDTTATDKDWYIFKHANSDDGHIYGDFYDFEVLREKVVSSTEVGRHYTNKWTIADIPFGQVLITNYSASVT